MSREAHVRFWEGVGVQLLCATQLGERHLLGILSKYVDYYNGTRTHLSLAKDAPEPRSVEPQSQGRQCGGGATRGWAPSRIPLASGVSHRAKKWKAQALRARRLLLRVTG